MLRDHRILLGVTGGIAAYKAVQLLRDFQKSGADVRVILSPAATRFVGLETFQALTGQQAACHMFREEANDEDAWVRHVQWAEWADLMIIAPCTANTLAKIAHGQADNLLTTTLLSFDGPVLVCPTMDGNMYQSPAIRENLQQIRSYNYHILEPEEGYLASGLKGKGRLPALNKIAETAEQLLDAQTTDSSPSSPNLSLKNRKVIVTAGPTREHLDPVRFISNPSSGKMGIAMAKAARNLGADVTLIHGPVSIDLPSDVSRVSITSAQELNDAVKNHKDADIFILAAAVSDFMPETIHDQKIKKSKAETTLNLAPTPDTLEWLGKNKNDQQTLIGFAMETENLIKNARQKRKRKKADWIIANSIADKNTGFGTDHNQVTVVGGDRQQDFEGTKTSIARDVLSYIFSDTDR
jgi:phosphopantothenoylcysteine decarboxylase/phosphopantothenate--cysteine ligase